MPQATVVGYWYAQRNPLHFPQGGGGEEVIQSHYYFTSLTRPPSPPLLPPDLLPDASFLYMSPYLRIFPINMNPYIIQTWCHYS